MSGTTSPANNAAAIARSQNDSQSTDELYHSSRLEENARICKLLEFFCVEDALNIAIWKMLQAELKKESSIDGMEFAIADIDDMAIELPSVESILEPAFFSIPALIFR